MKFSKLFEKKWPIDQMVLFFGAAPEFQILLDDFRKVLLEEIYIADRKDIQTIGSRDVPQKVLDAFRPLYEAHRKWYKEYIGVDIGELELTTP